jgi:hypothetical protein
MPFLLRLVLPLALGEHRLFERVPLRRTPARSGRSRGSHRVEWHQEPSPSGERGGRARRLGKWCRRHLSPHHRRRDDPACGRRAGRRQPRVPRLGRGDGSPNYEDCYVAGPLVAVYSSTDSKDVIRQVRRESLVFPPYAVVHVTGYMLALAHQGQEGFRVWVVESGGEVREHSTCL